MTLFRTVKPLIATLHVPALPGSPLHRLGFHEIRDWVLRDADVLAAGGFDGFILENFGDVPFDVPFYAQRPPHPCARLGAITLSATPGGGPRFLLTARPRWPQGHDPARA